jgi:hypothetical protein
MAHNRSIKQPARAAAAAARSRRAARARARAACAAWRLAIATRGRIGL